MGFPGSLLAFGMGKVWIGIGLVRSKATLEQRDMSMPLLKVITSACVVTWFNPQAIIDDILAGMDGKAKYKVIPDRREAIAWAVRNAAKDDIIVLMGKGQETYQEIGGQKLHLDEREEVAAYLAESR